MKLETILRCAVIFLAIVFQSAAVSGDAKKDVVPVDLFRGAASAILSGNYGEAEALCDRFITVNPEEPAGPLMKAAVIHYRSIDYEDYSQSREYFHLLDSAENLAHNKIEFDTRNLKHETPDEDRGEKERAWYFLCSARILRAVWSVTTGNFFSGIINARAAVKGLSRIKPSSAVFFDAQLTTGSYRFWKSEATKSVYWLPFIDDQRKQGIAEVEEALSKGTRVSPLSSTVLIEMLMVYDVKRAVACSESLAMQYPSCRLFRWQLGESLKRDGRYEDAVRILTGIAEEIANDPEDDGSGPLRCWWKLAVLSKSLGKNDDCKRYCEEILRIWQAKKNRQQAAGRSDMFYERQKKRIEGARKLLETLNND